jgi:hypothetical protein
MPKNSDPSGIVAVTAQYEPGVLGAILAVLEKEKFNLRAAGGRQIETGGEFAFWVDERVTGDVVDKDHKEATEEACRVLRKAGFDAYTVDVHSEDIDDTPGKLKAFVDKITAAKLLIEEIHVGTPRECEGGTVKKVPVQAYTVAAGKATPTP